MGAMSTCLSLEEIRSQMRSASFGGVKFHVENTTEDYGHRTVVHEFPNSDVHFSEPLGRKARRISINGYLVGKDWLEDRDKLVLTCESGGAQTLRHPFYQQFKIARALSLSVNETKEELGIVRFTLKLVEEMSIAPLLGLKYLPHLVRTSLDNLLSEVVTSFAAKLDVRLFGDSVRAKAIAAIEGWAQALDGARIVTALAGGAVLAAAIESVFDGAKEIVDGADPGEFVRPVVEAWRDAAESAESAATGLQGLIWTGVDERMPVNASATRKQEREVEIAVDQMFRQIFGALWAEFLVDRDFAGRREATEARNALVRWFDSEIHLIDAGADPRVYESFDRFRSRIIEDMGQKWTDSRPVIEIGLPRQVSAVYLADKLYADPDRAQELWRRNPSSSISLVGPCIEALAP